VFWCCYRLFFGVVQAHPFRNTKRITTIGNNDASPGEASEQLRLEAAFKSYFHPAILEEFAKGGLTPPKTSVRQLLSRSGLSFSERELFRFLRRIRRGAISFFVSASVTPNLPRVS